MAFSLFQADKNNKVNWSMVFCGIEPLKEEYRQKCIDSKLPFEAINTSERPAPLNWWLVFRAVVKMNPDVVLLHSTTMAFIVPVLRLLGIRVVAVDHTPNSTKRKNEWIALRVLFYFANKIVFLTPTHVQELRDKYKNRFPSKKSFIIGNGIDTSFFRPVEKSAPPPFLFTMQARFTYTKDFQTLIRAASLLKERTGIPFTVSLAGDGDKKKECELLAQHLGVLDVVHFEGMLSEPKLKDLLDRTHIYVHSSISEAMSTSIMQALSCGLPVIASDIAGITNLIHQDDNGWLFPVGDADKLALLMMDCMNGVLNIHTAAMKARKFAENELSMERMFDNYFNLLNQQN